MKKTTIFILGDNNFWYHTADVCYEDDKDLQKQINDAISEVRNGIANRSYDTDKDAEELHVITGEFKFSNLSV